ncbi:MAG: aromatic ring-hydroxylating dioxygenase subunit alpha [Rhodospirillaceae bacterium]|nr:MAG: aromatic ring-hydroxylating dioxygenase subunit alpha [Rhodospirillaceae bacterium]
MNSTTKTTTGNAAKGARSDENLNQLRLLPGRRYTSSEFAAAEWEQMWTKAWLLLGRESEMPEPGDYQVEEIGLESILMVRQKDGGVRAFYNVCQHRGNRLVGAECGGVDHFVCAYHGWKWGLDGGLEWVKDAEDFPADTCQKVRLAEIKCETFAGFVWVNMDPDCCSLREYLGPVWDLLQAFPLPDMRRYMALTTRVPCNWKCVHDNFNESYHVGVLHPQSSGHIDDNYKDTGFFTYNNGHSLMKMKSGRPARRGDKWSEPTPMLETLMHMWELNPDDFKGRPAAVREALQQQKRKLGPSRGYKHYEQLSDEQLTDFMHFFIFPNISASITADGCHFLRARPSRNDPGQCVFDNWFYATEPEGVTTPVVLPGAIVTTVPRGTDVPHEFIEYGSRSLGLGIDQDMSANIGQQLGFQSRGYKGGLLAGQENRVRHFHDTIDGYIAGHKPVRA